MKRTELERLRAMGAASLAAAAERVKRQTPEQRRAAFRDRLVELADAVVEAVSTGDLEGLNVAEDGLRQALLVARTLMGTNIKDKRDPAAWSARFAAVELAEHAAGLDARIDARAEVVAGRALTPVRRELEARDEQVGELILEVAESLNGVARRVDALERGSGAPSERAAEAVAVLHGHRQVDGRTKESDRAVALQRRLDAAARSVRQRDRCPLQADARRVAHAYCEAFPADASRLEGLIDPVLAYLRLVTARAPRGAGSTEPRQKAINAALAGVLRAAGARPARADSLRRMVRRKAKSGQ